MSSAPPVLPGWFGKLPGMGDFASRRLPEAFVQAWDAWLQRGLADLRDRHVDWVEHYLQGPLWFFALAPGALDEEGWRGVLMPSVDSVGRYFPLTLARQLVVPGRDERQEAGPSDHQWFALASESALAALELDLDGTGLDAALTERFGAAPASLASFASLGMPRSPQSLGSASSLAPPSQELSLPRLARNQSLWWNDVAAPEAGMWVDGLPRQDQFEALFGIDCATGALPAQALMLGDSDSDGLAGLL